MEQEKKAVVDKAYFNVTVYGDYFTSTSQGNVVKPFGPLPLKMRKWNSALTLARFHILPKLIHDVDCDFKAIRRCIILSITTPDGGDVYGLPLKYMSKKQIETECRANGIPLRSDMYTDIVELRTKLRKARENIEKFRRDEQRNIQAFNKIEDAFDLNKDLFKNLLSDQEKEIDLKRSSDEMLKNFKEKEQTENYNDEFTL